MPCLLLIITLRFTFGEEKIDKTSKFPQNIMPMVVGNILFCIFLSLLPAPIVKNSHILAEIYCIFLEKHPRPNLKVFQYYIYNSINRLEN